MKIYNKLVRDKIDEIINNNGKGEKAVVKILDDQEYAKELYTKLSEEFIELKQAIENDEKSAIVEESADLLEVIKAINGDDLSEVIKTMDEKREKRGGFTERKFLIGVELEKE